MIIQNNTVINNHWKFHILDEGRLIFNFATGSNIPESSESSGWFITALSFLMVESPYITFYYKALPPNIKCTPMVQEVLPDVIIVTIGRHTPRQQTILINSALYKAIFDGYLIAPVAQLTKNCSYLYAFDTQQSKFLRKQLYDYTRA